MKNSSRKAKGRYLQNIVKKKIIELFPYSIECKNRQDFKQLYSHFTQAQNHTPMEPLLVIKMNRKKPLAIIDLDHLFKLQKDED